MKRIHQALASLAIMTSFAVPAVTAQTYSEREHTRAKAQVEAKDAHHHNKAKIVGGSAVGGAVVGGLLGGGKGALIGGAVGAGGGVLANKARKHNSIKKQEQRNREQRY
ncbi:MAG: hypothetical protein JSS87_01180 [Acidobacteria bacterium]|nr:hypothetical protein [Acidobacteriota bacterium]